MHACLGAMQRYASARAILPYRNAYIVYSQTKSVCILANPISYHARSVYCDPYTYRKNRSRSHEIFPPKPRFSRTFSVCQGRRRERGTEPRLFKLSMHVNGTRGDRPANDRLAGTEATGPSVVIGCLPDQQEKKTAAGC